MADIQSISRGPQNGKNEKAGLKDGTNTPNSSVTDIQVVFEDVEAHIRYKEFKTKQVRDVSLTHSSAADHSCIGVWWNDVGLVNTESHLSSIFTLTNPPG